MSSHLFDRVVGAFASARSSKSYRDAKKLAGRLPLPQQFKVIDNAIACRARLMAQGVLV